ncbi:ATP-binding cassette domain-containing protein [Schumannella sp. 10F1B-5-1]|uniref:ATP-binding cassette domain-containing protein n=1 Tax=Schumannella sp. 10F1B-5-1 TaxID=2590780 RepID=UPI00113184E4|nr:ATP-binding cassette domain-containing protein [Schumannella sp. 10F1B-5-1]TPW70648.1 ATP-binding cassette domain-containing protein [Schumannella sp. 10F1B-5-1]
MVSGAVIEFSHLTKRFGGVAAVDDLSFRVEPGVVTGFLGPNGAGKTTTLRSLLGLVRPTSGSATFDGRPYAQLADPLRVVGTALEASSFHAGRSARDHLRVAAAAAGLPLASADAALVKVGLDSVARRRVGGFSLGMRQRLGLAFALLGDPGVLVLDEPINGLDPEGIRWIRELLRAYAAEGRTVLVSSHLLSEVQQTVDRAVVIARGRIVYQGDLAAMSAGGGARVRVDAADRPALGAALAGAVVAAGADGFVVTGLEPGEIGLRAHRAGVPLTLLAPERDGLEDVFLHLVGADPAAAHAAGGDAVGPSAHGPGEVRR